MMVGNQARNAMSISLAATIHAHPFDRFDVSPGTTPQSPQAVLPTPTSWLNIPNSIGLDPPIDLASFDVRILTY